MSTGTRAPRRICLSRAKGWRLPKNTIVVARPSQWGNPFPITRSRDRDACVAAFAAWIRDDPEGQRLAEKAKGELSHKNLACWCKLGQPCHADVLLRIANVG
jgi:hypothetical protein